MKNTLFYLIIIFLSCNNNQLKKISNRELEASNSKVLNLGNEFLNYAIEFEPKSPIFDVGNNTTLDSIVSQIGNDSIFKYSDAYFSVFLFLEKQLKFNIENKRKYGSKGFNLYDLKGNTIAFKIFKLYCKITEFNSIDEYLDLSLIYQDIEIDDKLKNNVYFIDIHDKIKKELEIK